VGVFSEAYSQYRDSLKKGNIIVAEGVVSIDEFTGGYKMSADRIWSIEQARELFAKAIRVDVKKKDSEFATKLAETLSPYRQGKCTILLNYQSAQGKVNIPLPEDWKVRPSQELLTRLGKLTAPENVHVVY